MGMNCKQFKQTQRVEKKQQFSFNPTEVNYKSSENNNEKVELRKPVIRDIGMKKVLIYFIISISALSIIKSFFS